MTSPMKKIDKLGLSWAKLSNKWVFGRLGVHEDLSGDGAVSKKYFGVYFYTLTTSSI